MLAVIHVSDFFPERNTLIYIYIYIYPSGFFFFLFLFNIIVFFFVCSLGESAEKLLKGNKSFINLVDLNNQQQIF